MTLCIPVIIQFLLSKCMSQRSKLTYQRLLKQQSSLAKQPIPNALVTRDGHLNFHFCLHDLDGPYSGGLYHGLFELHENYPFAAPKLYFYTPSGRFETNLPICTSFTNYHQETWTSAWNVRSLVLATISFMYSEQPSYGCRSDPQNVRRKYAIQSKKWNFERSAQFDRLFGEKLVKLGLVTQEERAVLTGKDKGKVEEKVSSEKCERSERSERSERNERSERSQQGEKEGLQQPLVINEERMEPLVRIDQHQPELPLLDQRKKQQNNNNQLRWTILKGVAITVVLVGGYLCVKYLM